jgi:NTP pyrophosphatase (non-canonical NTP hydrolase)
MTFDPEKTVQMSLWDVLVAEVSYWQREQFPDNTADDATLGMIEEVGELCHALLKSRQNIRGFHDKQKTKDAIIDACCDATIFAINYLNLCEEPIKQVPRVWGHAGHSWVSIVDCAQDMAFYAATGDAYKVMLAARWIIESTGAEWLAEISRVIGEVVKRDWRNNNQGALPGVV